MRETKSINTALWEKKNRVLCLYNVKCWSVSRIKCRKPRDKCNRREKKTKNRPIIDYETYNKKKKNAFGHIYNKRDTKLIVLSRIRSA